jgi:hypothetical protein
MHACGERLSFDEPDAYDDTELDAYGDTEPDAYDDIDGYDDSGDSTGEVGDGGE